LDGYHRCDCNWCCGWFFAGSYYQKITTRSNFSQFNFQQVGQRGNQNNRFGGGIRPVSGEIIKRDNDSITIKLRDGSTRIFFNRKTNIAKSQKGSLDDLKENENVFVVGQVNSDGSITAENIQIGNFQIKRG
jgi:hypothetical protein